MQSNKDTGVEYYRQAMPHRWLEDFSEFDCTALPVSPAKDKHGKDILISSFQYLDDDTLKQFQAIHFIRQIDMSGRTQMFIDRCHKNGCKVIFDIDDYWHLPKKHPSSGENVKKKYPEQAIEAMKGADLVTTTTDILAGRIAEYNVNVEVIPNSIDARHPQWQPIDVSSSRLRFGWVGGVHHLNDIALLKGCMKHFYNGNEWQMNLAGFNIQVNDKGQVLHNQYLEYEKTLTNEYAGLSEEYKKYLFKFSNFSEHLAENEPYRRLYSRDVYTYGHLYNFIDVAVIPLEESNGYFSHCKSELKLIEAGWMGKAAICSDVLPYSPHLKHRKNGFAVSTPYGFQLGMNYYYENPNARQEHALSLQEYVKENFSMEKTGKLRAEIYSNLLAA